MKVITPHHEPRGTSNTQDIQRILMHFKVVHAIRAVAFPALGVAAIVSLVWTSGVLPGTAVVAACCIAFARWITAHHKKTVQALLAEDSTLKPDERQQVQAAWNRVSVGGPSAL